MKRTLCILSCCLYLQVAFTQGKGGFENRGMYSQFTFDKRVEGLKKLILIDGSNYLYKYRYEIDIYPFGLLHGLVKYKESIKGNSDILIKSVDVKNGNFYYENGKIEIEWGDIQADSNFTLVLDVESRQEITEEQFSYGFLSWIEPQMGIGVTRVSKIQHYTNDKGIKLVPIEE
ncbi:MAG: hypothetical protein MRY83_14440 [Flavobacteriales bacterium]|nr:hypothetical protein [Flavobacteriales bacterium]